MSVNNTPPVIQHDGNGATTSFNYPFKVLNGADLVAQVGDATLVYGLDYVVTGVGDDVGGQVIFVFAPAIGLENVTLSRQVNFDRSTDYQYQGSLPAKVVNEDLDRVVMMLQQVNQDIKRSLKLPFATFTNQELTQTPAQRANMVLGFDADGNITVSVTDSANVIAAQEAAAAAVAAAASIDPENLVHRTGVESIAGIKDFTVSPTVPDLPLGTNTSQAVNAKTAKLFVDGAIKSSVRQTVLSGSIDANGYANMLSAGAGLALDLSATATPLVLSFANGFDVGGENNLLTRLTTNVAGVVVALAASNITYVYADYVSPTAVTWGKTLAPMQDGYTFDKTRQALLRFNGAVGSTALLDDLGNTWTAFGSAKLQSNRAKFGGTALGGGGTNNALNGTTDYVKSTGITTLGSGGWSMRGWVTAVGGLASLPNIFSAENAAGYGAYIRLDSSGRINLYLSSTGTSWDIANSPASGNTSMALNTDYFVELTYDPVAGKYFTYVGGACETNLTVSSAAKICQIAAMGIGADVATTATHFFNGYIDDFEFLPYCDHPNGVTYAVPIASPSVTSLGYVGDFFSIPEMRMYQVTGPSLTPGTNPAMTAKSRLYAGQASTSVAAVSGVINYAIRGRFYSGRIPGVANASYTKNHYTGSDQVSVTLRGAATPNGPLAQLEASIPSGTTYGGWFDSLDRNVIRLNSGNSGFRVLNATSVATAAEWDLTTIRNY